MWLLPLETVSEFQRNCGIWNSEFTNSGCPEGLSVPRGFPFVGNSSPNPPFFSPVFSWVFPVFFQDREPSSFLGFLPWEWELFQSLPLGLDPAQSEPKRREWSGRGNPGAVAMAKGRKSTGNRGIKSQFSRTGDSRGASRGFAEGKIHPVGFLAFLGSDQWFPLGFQPRSSVSAPIPKSRLEFFSRQKDPKPLGFRFSRWVLGEAEEQKRSRDSIPPSCRGIRSREPQSAPFLWNFHGFGDGDGLLSPP